MPIPSKETQDALSAILGPKTDRWRCLYLSLPPHWRGTIGRIRKGEAVSLAKENEVRHRLGLKPIYPPLVVVPPCPDCGSVHHARCHGNGGLAVVLADGETVRRPAAPRYRAHYWRPCLPATLTPRQRERVMVLAKTLEGQRE